MAMLRNGLASAGQLLVTDITSFTIPDTTASPTVGNFTNVFARYGAMAIGTGVTAAAATDTGLEAEITTGGGARKSGADVNTYLTDDVSGNDAWKANWQATWEFTAGFAVSEVVVGNSATANTGLHLTRQVFASPLDVVATDLLTLTVTVTLTGSFVAGGPSAAGGAVTHIGLREICRLMMDPTTTRQGLDGGAGDWESDDGHGASLKFDEIALDGLDTAVAQTQTALASELTTNGSARRSGANVTGTLMQVPSGNPPTFGPDTFTSFAGDTVQWRSTWTFTGSVTVEGQGVFNGDATKDVMLIRQIFAAGLDFVNTDTYTAVVRLVSQ